MVLARAGWQNCNIVQGEKPMINIKRRKTGPGMNRASRRSRKGRGRFIFLILMFSVLAVGLSAQSLNFPGKTWGLSFGNSQKFSGLRFNFRDKGVEKINGINLTLWKPYQENKEAVINGLSFGLLPGAARLHGIQVGLLGVTAEKTASGLNLGVIGSGSGGKLYGLNIGGLGAGAGENVTGINAAGLGLGAGESRPPPHEVRLLKVQGDGVMHGGLNAFPRQVTAQGVALLAARDPEMEAVSVFILPFRQVQREVAQFLVITARELPAAPVPGLQTAQFDAEKGGLYLVEAAVETDLPQAVALLAPVVAQAAQAARQLRVPGDHRAAVAVGAEVLGGIEAVTTRPSPGSAQIGRAHV